MSDDFLGDRRKALEDQFFQKQNDTLLAKLRTSNEREEQRVALEAASGIRSSELIDALLDLDIGADTFAALSLLPLILVSWADGVVDEKERAAVLSAASSSGISAGDVSHELLESWLAQKPADSVTQIWKDCTAALSLQLGTGTRNTLKRETIDRARTVAKATGGFLGFGDKISDVEEAVIADLEAAFSAS